MDERMPSGLSRRRVRLSDRETERRMLDAALARVADAGLTVSLEHIGFEDVIRDAGVARSAVYRRWPYKDMFFGDLLRELARGAGPADLPGARAAVDVARAAARAHRDRLTTSEGRRAALVDVLRQSAARDFEVVAGSKQWRTYIALHATFLSLPAGELRAEVHAALAESERRLTARIAAAHEHFATALGFRVRPGLGGFPALAGLLGATMRGLVVRAATDPDGLAESVEADPFATGPASWSPPALALAAITLTFVEPNPTITWDDARVAHTLQALGEPATRVALDVADTSTVVGESPRRPIPR